MPIFIENRQHILLGHIKTLLRQSQQACFALAFVRHSGVNLLKPEIESLIKRHGSIRVLFANDFGATESFAVEALQEIGADLKFIVDTISFHPKTYLFKTRKGMWAIVGSSNLSASGLSKGTEWSILLSPDDMDCTSILSEFNRLWASKSANEVTEEIISQLEQQDQRRAVRDTLRSQDQYPRKATVSKDKVLADKDNYIVRSRPNRLNYWAFGIYDNKVQGFTKRKGSKLVVVCDSATRQERLFVIPFSYLKEFILPSAYCDGDHRRYHFEINKQTFRFNWHHSIGMDGRQFVVKQKLATKSR